MKSPVNNQLEAGDVTYFDSSSDMSEANVWRMISTVSFAAFWLTSAQSTFAGE